MRRSPGVPRNCCPVCGGRIIVSYYYQYSKDYFVKKDGKLSSRYKVVDGGPEEASTAICESCDMYWNMMEFDVIKDQFLDYKDYDE